MTRRKQIRPSRTEYLASAGCDEAEDNINSEQEENEHSDILRLSVDRDPEDISSDDQLTASNAFQESRTPPTITDSSSAEISTSNQTAPAVETLAESICDKSPDSDISASNCAKLQNVGQTKSKKMSIAEGESSEISVVAKTEDDCSDSENPVSRSPGSGSRPTSTESTTSVGTTVESHVIKLQSFVDSLNKMTKKSKPGGMFLTDMKVLPGVSENLWNSSSKENFWKNLADSYNRNLSASRTVERKHEMAKPEQAQSKVEEAEDPLEVPLDLSVKKKQNSGSWRKPSDIYKPLLEDVTSSTSCAGTSLDKLEEQFGRQSGILQKVGSAAFRSNVRHSVEAFKFAAYPTCQNLVQPMPVCSFVKTEGDFKVKATDQKSLQASASSSVSSRESVLRNKSGRPVNGSKHHALSHTIHHRHQNQKTGYGNPTSTSSKSALRGLRSTLFHSSLATDACSSAHPTASISATSAINFRNTDRRIPKISRQTLSDPKFIESTSLHFKAGNASRTNHKLSTIKTSINKYSSQSLSLVRQTSNNSEKSQKVDKEVHSAEANLPSLIGWKPTSMMCDRKTLQHTGLQCACGSRYDSLFKLTMHMEETGHAPSSVLASTVEDFPKLVRGQDVWLSRQHEQTEMILRCMQCNKSFKSLPELTIHMIRTRHYVDIVGPDDDSERNRRVSVDSTVPESAAKVKISSSFPSRVEDSTAPTRSSENVSGLKDLTNANIKKEVADDDRKCSGGTSSLPPLKSPPDVVVSGVKRCLSADNTVDGIRKQPRNLSVTETDIDNSTAQSKPTSEGKVLSKILSSISRPDSEALSATSYFLNREISSSKTKDSKLEAEKSESRFEPESLKELHDDAALCRRTGRDNGGDSTTHNSSVNFTEKCTLRKLELKRCRKLSRQRGVKRPGSADKTIQLSNGLKPSSSNADDCLNDRVKPIKESSFLIKTLPDAQILPEDKTHNAVTNPVLDFRKSKGTKHFRNEDAGLCLPAADDDGRKQIAPNDKDDAKNHQTKPPLEDKSCSLEVPVSAEFDQLSYQSENVVPETVDSTDPRVTSSTTIKPSPSGFQSSLKAIESFVEKSFISPPARSKRKSTFAGHRRHESSTSTASNKTPEHNSRAASKFVPDINFAKTSGLSLPSHSLSSRFPSSMLMMNIQQQNKNFLDFVDKSAQSLPLLKDVVAERSDSNKYFVPPQLLNHSPSETSRKTNLDNRRHQSAHHHKHPKMKKFEVRPRGGDPMTKSSNVLPGNEKKPESSTMDKYCKGGTPDGQQASRDGSATLVDLHRLVYGSVLDSEHPLDRLDKLIRNRHSDRVLPAPRGPSEVPSSSVGLGWSSATDLHRVRSESVPSPPQSTTTTTLHRTNHKREFSSCTSTQLQNAG